MEQLRRVFGQSIFWVQPKALQRQFELRTDDQLIATLRFEKAFGTLATAESADGRWTFKRVGFLSPRVTVRRAGEETDLAEYRPRWTGTEGTLAFAAGRQYHWKTANFWATRFVWRDEGGDLLVTFQSGGKKAKLSDVFKTQARVRFEPAGEGGDDLPLLTLLGWYLIVLQQEDSAAVVAAAT